MKLETIYRYPDRTDVFLTAYLLGAVDRCAFSGARPALLICSFCVALPRCIAFF